MVLGCSGEVIVVELVCENVYKHWRRWWNECVLVVLVAERKCVYRHTVGGEGWSRDVSFILGVGSFCIIVTVQYDRSMVLVA